MSHDESVFPVTHSILSPRALRELAESEYDVGSVVRCQLLKRGMNDTYLLETAASRYVLRVYRTSWRSQPEILIELELLLYLHDSGIDVSTPLRRRAGDLLHGVIAPEGPREVALFTYAQGATPPMDDSHSRLFGGALAQLHTAMDSFPTSGPRFALDLDHLVRRPLQAIAAVFQHRPADIAFLQELGKRIELRMAELAQHGLTSGICHGDPWLGNVHMDRSERLTWFDFAYCGFGWRAYDLAVFRMGTRPALDPDLWAAFLDGYSQKRTLGRTDLDAVPVLLLARDIWHLGLWMENGNDWGIGWMDERYLDGRMRFMRERAAALPNLRPLP